MAVHYQIEGRRAVEISASIEQGVRRGVLLPGASLPPVRGLATQLGVAPATVAAAYKVLRQRGIVETAGRHGTRVRSRPPVARRLARGASVPGAIDLSLGEPDSALQPRLGPYLRELAERAGDPIRYGESGPWPELVELGRQRLAADGVDMTSAAVTVTSGALDALERLLAAHLRPGDRVGIEDPGWANLIDLVAALGLDAVGMPVDDQGPTVSGFERALAAGVGAVVVTSRAQNPTGATVSRARAAALGSRLRRHPEVLLIEDDHAAELAQQSLVSLASAASAWAFVRSVSKPYGPDLRVAVVAGDEATIARVEGRMRVGAGWVSTLLQRLVVTLWRDPAATELVVAAGVEYQRRRSGLLKALADRGIPAYGQSGLNVWLPVVDEATALARLRNEGWAVGPGAPHRIGSPPGLRITIGPMRHAPESFADAVVSAVNPAAAPVRR